MWQEWVTRVDARTTLAWKCINDSRHVTDMVELLPMSMKVLNMYPDNVGTWLFHCHVNDHIQGGMMALYTVEKINATQSNNTTGENLKIGLTTDTANPTTGQPTNLKVDFIDGRPIQ